MLFARLGEDGMLEIRVFGFFLFELGFFCLGSSGLGLNYDAECSDLHYQSSVETVRALSRNPLHG